MTTKLMEEILSKENLETAMKAVIANKGSAGVDGMRVNELPKFIEEHGEEITERIRKRKYRPLPVRRVQIPKPDGSKRNLGIPSVKDRWLQQAIYQVLNPMFEEVFSDSSYGFRPGRRCEDAIVKALEFMNDGYDWLVDMDLSKFFDNVNQDILMILCNESMGHCVRIVRTKLQGTERTVSFCQRSMGILHQTEGFRIHARPVEVFHLFPVLGIKA